MRRALIGLALVTVLAGCGDTSPFASPRYQIVKGTHHDYLLDTKTGRTWRYRDSAAQWVAIFVDNEREEDLSFHEELFKYRRTPPQSVTPGFPWNLYSKMKRKSWERKAEQ